MGGEYWKLNISKVVIVGKVVYILDILVLKIIRKKKKI